MFNKVLYPTDFSGISKKALSFIKQLKESGTKEIVALHVIDIRTLEPFHRFLDEDKYKELEKKRRENVRDSLKAVEKELKEVDFKVKGRIEIGIPFREILRVEKEEDVSLVVIGSHGMSNLEEIFLGSVSEKVIRRCKKPVLVIKREH
ncbi:MAG: universal stress protein [Pseudomonadota bacterium]